LIYSEQNVGLLHKWHLSLIEQQKTTTALTFLVIKDDDDDDGDSILSMS